MDKKQYMSFAAIIIIILGVSIFFRDPASSDTSNEENETDSRNISIDYINLKEENKELKKETEHFNEKFNSNMFGLMSIIVDSDSISEILPYPESTEILYKEIQEKEFTIIYKDKTGYNLNFSSIKSGYVSHWPLFQIEPTDDINWTGGTSHNEYFLGGFITDTEIKTVQVYENDEVHETNIIELTDNTSVWYTIFDYERKSTPEDADQIKIEALDKDGIILWEDSFVSDTGW